MRGDLGSISRNRQLADTREGLRRLRIPPHTKNYTRFGAILAGSGVRPLRNNTGHVLSVSSVQAEVGTAPSSTAVILDVTIDGVSIFSTGYPTVATGTTAGTVTAPDDNQWLPGESLFVNVTQGDTDAADLHVTLVIG